MPPGSFLEVVGVPRVVHLEDSKGSMLEIPMQISCPKTATIEQTRASRKTSLLSMVDHLLLEVRESLSLSSSFSHSCVLSHITHIRIYRTFRTHNPKRKIHLYEMSKNYCTVSYRNMDSILFHIQGHIIRMF